MVLRVSPLAMDATTDRYRSFRAATRRGALLVESDFECGPGTSRLGSGTAG